MSIYKSINRNINSAKTFMGDLIFRWNVKLSKHTLCVTPNQIILTPLQFMKRLLTVLTLGVSALASCGPTNPGMVPAVLVIPMRTPANLGAMSMWLTQYPDNENPVAPKAIVR